MLRIRFCILATIAFLLGGCAAPPPTTTSGSTAPRGWRGAYLNDEHKGVLVDAKTRKPFIDLSGEHTDPELIWARLVVKDGQFTLAELSPGRLARKERDEEILVLNTKRRLAQPFYDPSGGYRVAQEFSTCTKAATQQVSPYLSCNSVFGEAPGMGVKAATAMITGGASLLINAMSDRESRRYEPRELTKALAMIDLDARVPEVVEQKRLKLAHQAARRKEQEQEARDRAVAASRAEQIKREADWSSVSSAKRNSKLHCQTTGYKMTDPHSLNPEQSLACDGVGTKFALAEYLSSGWQVAEKRGTFIGRPITAFSSVVTLSDNVVMVDGEIQHTRFDLVLVKR